jgi:hypothetical protein
VKQTNPLYYPYEVGDLLERRCVVPHEGPNNLVLVVDKDKWSTYFTVLSSGGVTRLCHGDQLSYPERK